MQNKTVQSMSKHQFDSYQYNQLAHRYCLRNHQLDYILQIYGQLFHYHRQIQVFQSLKVFARHRKI